MGYGTQHPHSQKEHTELYNILKFGVNQANIRKDTAIQKLQILLRNVWNAGRDPIMHRLVPKPPRNEIRQLSTLEPLGFDYVMSYANGKSCVFENARVSY